MKKKWFTISFLLIIGIILLNTNPTKEDYDAIYSPEQYATSDQYKKYYELERIDFFLFSTYTPFFAAENGKTHLGILGHFIPISEGQFDYPKWLEIFHHE